MRCKLCNVDVSEHTKKCPLCGVETVAEEPAVKGIQTASYPKVKYVKPKPPYNAIFGLIWLIASVVTLVIDLKINRGDFTYTLLVATTIPCIWSFLFRPMYTAYYYIGRYVMSDVIFLSLWLLVISAKLFSSIIPAMSYMIPAVLTIALLALLLNALFVKKNTFRAPPFMLMLGAISLILGVISVFVNDVKFFIYLIPLALMVFSLILLKIISPYKVKEELKARFHA